MNFPDAVAFGLKFPTVTHFAAAFAGAAVALTVQNHILNRNPQNVFGRHEQ